MIWLSGHKMLKFGNTIWAAQLATRPDSSVLLYEKLSTYVSPKVSVCSRWIEEFDDLWKLAMWNVNIAASINCLSPGDVFDKKIRQTNAVQASEPLQVSTQFGQGNDNKTTKSLDTQSTLQKRLNS